MVRDCTRYSSNIVFLNLHPKPMENIIFLNLQMRYIIGHTTWDPFQSHTSFPASTCLIPPYSLHFLWWCEFRKHVPLWTERNGSNGAGIFFRQSEAYSRWACCVFFLFTSSQSRDFKSKPSALQPQAPAVSRIILHSPCAASSPVTS